MCSSPGPGTPPRRTASRPRAAADARPPGPGAPRPPRGQQEGLGGGGVMTAIAAQAGAPGAAHPGEPGLFIQARWAVSDTLTITWRNLLVWMRVPAYIVFTVIQPVMFVLMFRYVFGGAIPVAVSGGYREFLMPGIIGQTAAFATFGTAIAL